MVGDVHALLVGIDDYGGRLPGLNGCVNDIRGFAEFLVGRVPEERLHVVTLFDGEATRQRVIDGFTGHLSGAGAGDVVVFYYSGHGSQEPVEERYWRLEPTGHNQTIVCYDSRRPGVPDLADKELSELIGGVAAGGAHVLVVLDCCHSGGGTRDPGTLPADVRARFAPPAERPRALDAYLPGVGRAMIEAGGTDAAVAAPRHVSLAACESGQLAVEMPIGARRHGIFSAMLLRALADLGPAATYRELLGAATAAVRDRVFDQHPVGYAAEPGDLDEPVFGGAVRLPRSQVTLEHVRGAWWIDAGSVHGIQPPQGAETTVVAVLPPRRADSALPDAAPPLGSARVVEVEPARSRVTIADGWQPDSGVRYPVAVTDVPLPPASVDLRGDPGGVALVRAALVGSPHVEEGTGDPGTAGDRFVVLAEAGRLTVARADATPLAEPVQSTSDGARLVRRQLEHLARWHLIKRLDNPVSVLAGSLSIEVVAARPGEPAPRAGELPPIVPADDGRILLRYQHTPTGLRHPYIYVYLRNDSARDLYCSLLDLTDRFRCHSRLFPGALIPARTTVVAFEGRPIDVSIPKERLEAGGTEVHDWLKLIAAEQRFAADAYELPTLGGTVGYRGGDRRRGPRTVLDRLANRAVHRDAGDEAVDVPEWTTTLVTLRTVRDA
ncbi:caspase family protein [Dactylosporangium darangshiense]|uniref:Peptidase C14 caspase domain-containing protein n=1 Tax=Dactylosporangium darangshiense TaxID=579108 RepID=A0ABP8DUK0_9ACTN